MTYIKSKFNFFPIKKTTLLSIVVLFSVLAFFSANSQTRINDLIKRADTIEYREQLELYRQLCFLYSKMDSSKKQKFYAEKMYSIAKKHSLENYIERSYYNIGRSFHRSAVYDSAYIYYNKSIEILENEDKDTLEKFMVYIQKAFLLRSIGRYDEAIESCKQMNERTKGKHEYWYINIIGNIYSEAQQYDNALDQFFILLENSKLNKDTFQMGIALLNIGHVYEKTNNYDKSIEFNRKSLKIAYGINSNELIFKSLNNLGIVEKAKGNYLAAAGYIRRSISIFDNQQEIEGLASLYNNLAIILRHIEEYDNALANHDKAISIIEKTNEIKLLSEFLYSKSKTLIKDNRNTEAIKCIHNSINLCAKYGFNNQQARNYKELYLVYEKSNDTKKAYSNLELYTLVNDSINAKEKRNRKKMFDKKLIAQQTINKLSEEKKYHEVELKEFRLYSYMLVLGSLVVIVLLLSLYSRSKHRNKIIAAEQKQMKIQIGYNEKELMSHTLKVAEKMNLISVIKETHEKILPKLTNTKIKNEIRLLNRSIYKSINTNDEWDTFETHFENVHPSFLNFIKSQFPSLTKNEIKLCAYTKIKISIKEISQLQNISERSVIMARYRLKKKMELGADVDFDSYIWNLNKPITK